MTAELERKNHILEKETKKLQKIEEDIREKKKDHGKTNPRCHQDGTTDQRICEQACSPFWRIIFVN